MGEDRYKEAGVDIEAGDEAVRRIAPHAKRTLRPEVLTGLGGFGGLFAVPEGYRDPVLVSGTDGVGTKLLLAILLDKHDTIGIDLVAMCVNDIAVTGAEPLFFLDYFATGKLAPTVVEQVVKGIADGCLESGCALIGGETAEMPGMYPPGHYDLAGFAVGVVERDGMLDGKRIEAGDAVVGVPSSGLHSNGYSLARRLLVDSGRFDLSVDPGGLGAPLGEVLLTPTRLYPRLMADIAKRFDLRGAAHITGGGLLENVPRVLPEGLGVAIERGSWTRPPIFELLEAVGELSEREMHRTFNNGVGMALVVPAEQADEVAAAVGGWRIGTVETGAGVRLT